MDPSPTYVLETDDKKTFLDLFKYTHFRHLTVVEGIIK